jgi:hypothetical protein
MRLWEAIGALALFAVLSGMLLLLTYKSGHSKGRHDEHEVWIRRLEADERRRDERAARPPAQWALPPPPPPIRAKTGPLPPVPRVGPIGPPPRTHTTAADIRQVIMPVSGARIPLRPQPAPMPAGTASTGTLEAITTGGMRAVTDDLIRQIEAGTWPPREATAS